MAAGATRVYELVAAPREPVRVEFFRGKLAEVSSIVTLDNVSFADETAVNICKHTPCLTDYQERVAPASGDQF